MSLLGFFAAEYRRLYAFCPTGEGGGIDNSCSPLGENKSIGNMTPTQIAGRIWYRGHDVGMPFGQTETFIAMTPQQAAPFGSQKGGIVSEIRFTKIPRIYPSPIPWEEYQRTWRNSVLLSGYDAVPIIEPNGQSISLAVRNLKILKVGRV